MEEKIQESDANLPPLDGRIGDPTLNYLMERSKRSLEMTRIRMNVTLCPLFQSGGGGGGGGGRGGKEE